MCAVLQAKYRIYTLLKRKIKSFDQILMKKIFIKPVVEVVTLMDTDVIATSEGVRMSNEGEEFNARSRGNSIWDD